MTEKETDMLRLTNTTAAFTLFATAAMADPGGDYYGHMWGGGFGMLGGLMMIVFWGVIIALIFFAVRWFSEKGRASGSSAHDILRDRFARGEIDEEEYRKRKAALDD